MSPHHLECAPKQGIQGHSWTGSANMIKNNYHSLYPITYNSYGFSGALYSRHTGP